MLTVNVRPLKRTCCTNQESLCNDCMDELARKTRKALRRMRSYNLDQEEDMTANDQPPLELPTMDFAEPKKRSKSVANSRPLQRLEHPNELWNFSDDEDSELEDEDELYEDGDADEDALTLPKMY